MDYEDIRVETRGPSNWIFLDRPKQMNAVRPQTHPELADAFEHADADPDTNFIVLTGTGRGFCAGDDFQEIFFADDGPGKRSDAILNRYRTRHGAATPLLDTILRCTKPTIAALNGAAVGIGMDLALLCDVRIAGESAKMGSFFVRRGVIGTAAGTWLLPRMIGVSRAMELLLSGELLDAAACERMSLVSRVVPDAELEQAVMDLIEKLSWGAPLAQRAIKRCVQRGLEGTFDSTEEYGRLLSDELWRTEDHMEGVMSHVEKRKPSFKSR